MIVELEEVPWASRGFDRCTHFSPVRKSSLLWDKSWKRCGFVVTFVDVALFDVRMCSLLRRLSLLWDK